MKVGYLGPKGTFSYEICNAVYHDSIEKIPYRTIRDTILALINDEVEEIMVPIENSLQGCVTETLDTILENDKIYIKSQKILKINQNLLARELYPLEEIEEVYSHPQALAQCRNYLEKNLINASVIEVSSTALAAKEVVNKKKAACIGNIECSKEYGLKIIQPNIQDNDFNATKFWVLSKNENSQNNADVMTIIFTAAHKPGALYKTLGIFERNDLNLLKIESRPAKTTLGEYYFWIDVDIKNKDYTHAMKELENHASFYRILGKY